jgi:hypothetical protein
MEEERKDQRKKVAKVIAMAWSDESFKEKLLSDPRAVLEANGIDVPEGFKIKMLEEKDDTRFFILPQPPEEISVTDIEDRLAAWTDGICVCVSH